MKKAFVLAGGQGRRLRPYTFVIPKPLMPISEKPVIGLVLHRLIKYGFEDITISTGHMGALLVSVVNSLELPARISYTKEDSPLGTVGSLILLEDFDDDLLVMNGDLLTNLNLANMYDFHKKKMPLATIGVFTRDLKIDFGVIHFDESGNYKDYIEKPTHQFDVSMGINVLSPAVKKYIQENQYLDMPTLIKRIFSNQEQVLCYREKCKWLDIGREHDYQLATEEFENNKTEYL